jgi:hypothetical protein
MAIARREDVEGNRKRMVVRNRMLTENCCYVEKSRRSGVCYVMLTEKALS